MHNKPNPDERKKNLIKLFNALKSSPFSNTHALEQIREAAIKAEQISFEQSKTIEEYLYKMNEKYLKITKMTHTSTHLHPSIPTEPGYNISESSSNSNKSSVSSNSTHPTSYTNTSYTSHPNSTPYTNNTVTPYTNNTHPTINAPYTDTFSVPRQHTLQNNFHPQQIFYNQNNTSYNPQPLHSNIPFYTVSGSRSHLSNINNIKKGFYTGGSNNNGNNGSNNGSSNDNGNTNTNPYNTSNTNPYNTSNGNPYNNIYPNPSPNPNQGINNNTGNPYNNPINANHYTNTPYNNTHSTITNPYPTNNNLYTHINNNYNNSIPIPNQLYKQHPNMNTEHAINNSNYYPAFNTNISKKTRYFKSKINPVNVEIKRNFNYLRNNEEGCDVSNGYSNGYGATLNNTPSISQYNNTPYATTMNNTQYGSTVNNTPTINQYNNTPTTIPTINTPFIYHHNTINRHPSIFNEMPEFLRYNDIPQESNKNIKTVKSPVIKIDRQSTYSKDSVKYTEQEIKHNNEVSGSNGYNNNGYGSGVNNTPTTIPYNNTPTPLSTNNTTSLYNNIPLNNRMERDIYNTNYRQCISQQQDTSMLASPRKRGRKSKFSPSSKKIQNISSYSESNLDSKDKGVINSNNSANIFDRIMGSHFDNTMGVNKEASSVKGVSNNYYGGGDQYSVNRTSYGTTVNNTSLFTNGINNTPINQYNPLSNISYNNTPTINPNLLNTSPYINTPTINPSPLNNSQYINTPTTNLNQSNSNPLSNSLYNNTPITNSYNNPVINTNPLSNNAYNGAISNSYNNTPYNTNYPSNRNKVVVCKKVEEIKEEETWKLQEKNLSRSLNNQEKRFDSVENVTKKVETKVVELSRKEIVDKVLKEVVVLEEEHGGCIDYNDDNEEESGGEDEGILTPDDLMDRLIEERRVFFEEGVGVKMVKGFNVIEEGGGVVNNKNIEEEGVNDENIKEGVNNSIEEGVSNSIDNQHPFNNTTNTQHPFNNLTVNQHPFNNSIDNQRGVTEPYMILKCLEYKPNISSESKEDNIKQENELTPHEKYKLLTNKIEDGSIMTSDTYFLNNKIFGFKIKLKTKPISDEECNEDTNKEGHNKEETINEGGKEEIIDKDNKEEIIEDVHSKLEWLNAFVRKNKKDLKEEEKKEIILKLNLNKNSLLKMENVGIQFLNLCGKNEEYFKFLRVKCLLEKQAFCVSEDLYFLDDKTVRALFEYLKELNALLIKEIEKSSVKLCDKGEISFRKCILSAVNNFEGSNEEGLNVLVLSKKR